MQPHQRHTPINPAVIHAAINNNPAHSSTQPDQIWAQIIRGEVIFMGEDSGVCQKRANFDIIWGAHWPTSIKTGDRNGQITRRDFVTKPRIQLFYSWPWSCCCCWAKIIPRSFHKHTASAFLPLTKYDHPQSREKSRGFSFSGAAKSVVHSSEIIISAPVTVAGVLRISYTPICSYFTAFKPWWQM